MVGELSRKEEVSVHFAKDVGTASGADCHGLNPNLLNLAALRNCNGETLGVAHTPGDTLNDEGQGLRLVEVDDPAHSRAFEAYEYRKTGDFRNLGTAKDDTNP